MLNKKFNDKIKALETEEKQEIAYNLHQQQLTKEYEETAKIRFETIKQQKEAYLEKTSKMFSKIEFLKKFILEIKKSDRVIIFSDFTSIFTEIVQLLHDNQINPITLDGGNINSLQKSIDLYKAGLNPVLMSNSYMYGYGMNLPETTHIILVHKLDCPLRKEQLIARAQRPGRNCRLQIYELLHKNEL